MKRLIRVCVQKIETISYPQSQVFFGLAAPQHLETPTFSGMADRWHHDTKVPSALVTTKSTYDHKSLEMLASRVYSEEVPW